MQFSNRKFSSNNNEDGEKDNIEASQEPEKEVVEEKVVVEDAAKDEAPKA